MASKLGRPTLPAQKKMKQVALRMETAMHRSVKKEAKRCGQSFGAYVREAVEGRMAETLKWEPER
jgi:predicted HicB family RNase H-like nuclease